MSDTQKGEGAAILDALLKAISRDNLNAVRDTRTVTGTAIEGTLQAYAALSEAVGKALGAVPDDATAVLLQTEEAQPARVALQALRQRITRLERQMGEAIARGGKAFPPEEEKLATVAVSAVIGSLVSAAFAIGGLFRTETATVHAAATLDNRALLAIAAGELLARKPQRAVLIGGATGHLAPAENGPLFNRLAGLDASAARVAALLARIGTLSAEEQARHVETKTVLDSAAKAHAALVASFNATGTEGAPIALALEGAAIEEALGDKGVVLAMKVLAGSSTQKTENDFVTHAGGAVLTYTLFDADGAVRAAGIEHGITKYLTAGDMRRLGD